MTADDGDGGEGTTPAVGPSPRVSAIICTMDRPKMVQRLVCALEEQTLLPDEVIVIDDSERADLKELLEGRDRIFYVHGEEHSGLTAARNTGIHLASGDICVFLDDDIVPEPDLLEHLVEAYRRDPSIGGAGGIPAEPEVPSRARFIFLRIFQRGPFAHPASFQQSGGSGEIRRVNRLSGAIASYKKEVLEKFSFDENLVAYCLGEDMDHSWRVSREYPLVLVPEARALHDVLGWTSLDMRNRFRNKVLTYTYHYLKNLRGSLKYAMLYGWLLVGIAGEAVIYTFLERNADTLRGLFDAIHHIREDMDDAGGFIRKDPRTL